MILSSARMHVAEKLRFIYYYIYAFRPQTSIFDLRYININLYFNNIKIDDLFTSHLFLKFDEYIRFFCKQFK